MAARTLSGDARIEPAPAAAGRPDATDAPAADLAAPSFTQWAGQAKLLRRLTRLNAPPDASPETGGRYLRDQISDLTSALVVGLERFAGVSLARRLIPRRS